MGHHSLATEYTAVCHCLPSWLGDWLGAASHCPKPYNKDILHIGTLGKDHNSKFEILECLLILH